MSAARRKRSAAAKANAEEPPGSDRSPQGASPSGRRAPKLLHYFYLNLAVWFFLAVQAVILSRSLGSSQTVILFSVLLGMGFLVVSVFDYTWLRLQR